MARPKLAIIGTRGYPSYYGGFETAVRRLAPFLVGEGWDVTVYGRVGAVRSDDPDRHPLVRSRLTKGVEKKSLSTLSYGFTSVLHAAFRERPDVALVMNVANGYWLPLLRARGIPTLVNVDGIEWERAKWGRLARGVFRCGASATARWSDTLVYDSREIARRWNERSGRGGEFIPYGGDEVPELAPVNGLEHRKYALLVARFVEENTVREFLDAVPVIAQRADVVIVGSSGYGGELDERVRSLAEQCSRVTWLGHLSDDTKLHSLWQHAGVYFHGHSVGGTNPALVQAMAAGAPTIARDTAYNREVLGEAGVFVTPVADAIATETLALLEDPGRQESLSRASVRRAREHYTWLDVSKRYEAALRSLLPPRIDRS